MVGEAAHQLANMNTTKPINAEDANQAEPATKTNLDPNVDPTSAVITMKSGQIMYQANLEVLKSADEMRGRAADLIA